MDTCTLSEKLQYKIPQFKLAIIRESAATKKPVVIRTPKDMHRFLAPLRHFPEEHFVAFHLNALNGIIGMHEVSHGTLSASLVHPREVFKAALLSNAHAIIVAHNHPGGSLRASTEDVETTKQLVEAGRVLGVNVVDHVIVAARGYLSLREEYPSLWG